MKLTAQEKANLLANQIVSDLNQKGGNYVALTPNEKGEWSVHLRPDKTARATERSTTGES